MTLKPKSGLWACWRRQVALISCVPRTEAMKFLSRTRWQAADPAFYGAVGKTLFSPWSRSACVNVESTWRLPGTDISRQGRSDCETPDSWERVGPHVSPSAGSLWVGVFSGNTETVPLLSVGSGMLLGAKDGGSCDVHG